MKILLSASSRREALAAGAAFLLAVVPSPPPALAVGEELAAGGVTVRMFVNATSEIRSSSNVIAETPGGRYDRVVVVGAHLDSVPEGPGIGPKGISRRLALGHEPVERFEHEIHRIVAEGNVVITEHTETWCFHTDVDIAAASIPNFCCHSSKMSPGVRTQMAELITVVPNASCAKSCTPISLVL